MAAASGAAPSGAVTVQGRLIYKDSPKKDLWSLRTDSDIVYSLPGQPLDSLDYPIRQGNIISLTCTPGAGGTPQVRSCDTVSGATVVRAAAPVRSTNFAYKLLVIVVSLSGGCTVASAPVANVSNSYQGAGGYISFMKACSYGSVTIDPNALKVIGVTVPCTAQILQCHEDSVAANAMAAARQQLGALTVASFTHFSYVMPKINTCDWVGLAELPGTRTWYAPNNQGIFDKGTVMQELLHNVGIYHGWRDGVEYNDYSTAMGSGESCPSAPELWRLGWATPVAVLNAASFAAKVFKTYTLPATVLTSQAVAVKIQPNWLGGAYSRNVYLALRARIGADKDLQPEFAGKVNVHDVAMSIDNNFNAAGDPRVSILGTIAPSGSLDLKQYKLFIRTGALQQSGTAIIVKVCRYLVSAAECKDPAA